MIHSNVFEAIQNESGIRRIDNIYIDRDGNSEDNSFSIELNRTGFVGDQLS